MIVANSTIRVRYAETDMMGIAYYGNYFTWFEVARIRMLDDLGMPYRELEEQGFRLPVLETKAEYKKPARFDDEVEIKTLIKEMPTVRFTIDYELFVESKLISTGYTRHAFTNMVGQPTRPPDIFITKLKKHFSPEASSGN
jgi:acyl-CoA thioester hydrolase